MAVSCINEDKDNWPASVEKEFMKSQLNIPEGSSCIDKAELASPVLSYSPFWVSGLSQGDFCAWIW